MQTVDVFHRPATRFAPSPSGRLHLGHAYSALFAAEEARRIGGLFLLRIEDIDTARCKPEFEAGILEDLSWLGLRWAEPVLRQSDRLGLYRDFLHVLEEGGLTYPCFCTRKQIQAEIADATRAPHGPDGPLYPGTCKTLSAAEGAERIAAGEAHAIRLHMDKAGRMTGPLTFVDEDRGVVPVRPESCGDIVLARKDIATSYHIAVTVDDALQHVSLVTRGEDLLHATHIHRVLQTLWGFPEPRYRHHKLLSDAAGRRYAKRDRAATLAELRATGETAEAVRRRLGFE